MNTPGKIPTLPEPAKAGFDHDAVGDWFFTFGAAHCMRNGESLAYRYYVIRGMTYDQARLAFWKLRGRNWGFQYPIAELADQIRAYGLTETQLEGDNP